MSNFIGKLVELMYELSPYAREVDFDDHVVIIGYISDDEFYDFMEELVENDKVDKQKNLQS